MPSRESITRSALGAAVAILVVATAAGTRRQPLITWQYVPITSSTNLGAMVISMAFPSDCTDIYRLDTTALGATGSLPWWVARGWRKPGGGEKCYGNRDLWEALQGRVEELMGAGCEVGSWLMPGGGITATGEDGIVRTAKVAGQRAARERGLLGCVVLWCEGWMGLSWF